MLKIKTCSQCGKELPLDNFSWKDKKNGIKQSECKECHKKYDKKHYKNNKKYYIDKNKKRQEMLKRWLDEYKSNLKCKNCGEDYIYCLEFHHKDPNKKEIDISQTIRRGWSIKRIKKEIDKCIVLCANCHRKLHGGIIDIETLI